MAGDPAVTLLVDDKGNVLASGNAFNGVLATMVPGAKLSCWLVKTDKGIVDSGVGMLRSPQHLTPLAVVSAHMYCAPAARETTPLSKPFTSTGVELPVPLPLLLPSPSWPEPLKPQHLTAPPVVSAHV